MNHYNFRRRVNGTRISESHLPALTRNIRRIDINSGINLKNQKTYALTSEEANHYLAFTEQEANEELRRMRYEDEDYIKYFLDNNTELKNIVTTLVDSCIVYDKDNMFCDFSLNKKVYPFTPYQESMLSDLYKKHMKLLNFTNEQEAWTVFYSWLCSGKVNYEIIYKTITRKEKRELIVAEKKRIQLYENKVKGLKKNLVDLSESSDRVLSNKKIKESLNEIKKSTDKIKLLENGEKLANKLTKLNEEQFEYSYRQVIEDNLGKIEADEIETDEDSERYKLPIGNQAIKYKKVKENEESELIPIEIVGIKRLSANTVTRVDVIGEDGENVPMYKVQDYMGRYFYMPKESIVEIDWGKVSGNSRYSHRSYVDTLRRNFNLTRSLEESRVGWNILVGQFRLKMVVPTGSKLGVKAKEAVSKLVNQYRERLTIDEVDGVIKINGNKSYQFGRNIALPSRNGNTTQIDSIAYNGVDLSNMEVVEYFRDATYRDSNIPKSRFDRDNNLGSLLLFKTDGIPFDELFFHKMSKRLLNEFSKAIRLPVYYDAILKDPSLSLDDDFYNSLQINFNADSYYELAKEQELERAKLANLSSFERFQDSQRSPLFSLRYLLVEKFKVITQEQWDLNQRYLEEDKKIEEKKPDSSNTVI